MQWFQKLTRRWRLCLSCGRREPGQSRPCGYPCGYFRRRRRRQQHKGCAYGSFVRPLRPHVVRELPIVGLGLPSNGGRRHTWRLAAFPLWSASLRRTRKRPKLVTLGLAKLISEVAGLRRKLGKRKGGKKKFLVQRSELTSLILTLELFFTLYSPSPPFHV